MGIKSFSRARAIHVMLVYTGGCNGCDIEIVNSILSPRFDAEQYNVFLTWNPREADVLVVTGPGCSCRKLCFNGWSIQKLLWRYSIRRN